MSDLAFTFTHLGAHVRPATPTDGLRTDSGQTLNDGHLVATLPLRAHAADGFPALCFHDHGSDRRAKLRRFDR